MGEIKIVLSNRMNDVLEGKVGKIGIKKTEFVKSLVIEDLKKRRKWVK